MCLVIFLFSQITSLFASAYYGLFRVGELTSGEHPIKVTDVHVGGNKQKILFVLRTSKMHWSDNKPQFVKIMKTSLIGNSSHTYNRDLSFCPCDLIKCYMRDRRSHGSKQEPFYVFKHQTPVRLRRMRWTLQQMLTLMG